jgi:ribonuclease T2
LTRFKHKFPKRPTDSGLKLEVLIKRLIFFFVVLTAVPAHAQLIACHIPQALLAPSAETAPPGERRAVPVTRYTLALSWSPEFCHAHKGDPRHAVQCGGADPFGFILHGLWPEGDDAHPAWCRAADALPVALIRQNLCMMPGVQLQQHEWAKHGTCAESDPAHYFSSASRLYGGLLWPDMNQLSRSPQTALSVVTAFARLNPGLTTDVIRVRTSHNGWLQGLALCLDKGLHATRCPAGAEGAAAGDPVRIWRLKR